MLKLLRLRFRSFINSSFYPENRRKAITGPLFLLVLAGGLLYLLISLVPRGQSIGPTGDFLISQGLQVGFSFAFFYLLIGGINSCLNSLFLSGDLSFLQSLPLSFRTVFTYKFISAWIDNTKFVSLIAFPLLISYGIYSGVGPGYYMVMLIGFLAFTVLITGLASLLMLLAVKFSPPNRLRRILQVLGALVTSIIFGIFYFNFYTGESGIKLSSDQLARLEGIFSHPAIEWLPGGWLASSLTYFTGFGNFANFFVKFALLLLGAIAIFWISRSFLMGAFAEGSTAVREVPTSKNQGKGSDLARSSSPLLSPAFLAIAKREYLTYIRNLQILSNLFLPLTASIIFPVIIFIRVGNPGSVLSPYLSFIGVWIFLFYFSGPRIAQLSIFSEKGSKTAVLTSPIAGERLIRLKVLTYFVPTILIAEIYHVVGSIVVGAGVNSIVAGSLILPFISIGLNSFGISIAASSGEPKVDNPGESLSGLWRLLIFLGVAVYLIIAGFAVFCALHPESIPYLDHFGQIVRRAVGGIALIVMPLLVSHFSIKLAGAKLHHREW